MEGSLLLKPIMKKNEGENFWGENFFLKTNCYFENNILGKKLFLKNILREKKFLGKKLLGKKFLGVKIFWKFNFLEETRFARKFF